MLERITSVSDDEAQPGLNPMLRTFIHGVMLELIHLNSLIGEHNKRA